MSKIYADDNIHTAIEKVARVFGAHEPSHLHNAAISYKKRRKAYEKYLKAKSKESKTPWNKSLGVGGAVGLGAGGAYGGFRYATEAAYGVGKRYSPRSVAAAAALGAVLGVGAGALYKVTDDEKIRQAKKVLRKGTVDESFQKRILSQTRRQERKKDHRNQRRHNEMMNALRSSSR